MTNSNPVFGLQVTRNYPVGEHRSPTSNVPDLGGSSLTLISTFSPDIPKTSSAPQGTEEQDSTAILHRSRYGE
jgi:hypothetical protein